MTLLGEETCSRLTLDGHLTPTCSCYEEGYSQGKAKLELGLESCKPDAHMEGCGCVPCRFARRIRHYERPR